MNYPVNCKKCNQPLYGPVKFCPFCSTASDSVTATSEKQHLDALKDVINSSLMQGEYTPAIRGDIRRKGKEIGITEKACDALLLAALKEKEFSPEEEIAGDPLSVCWYSVEKGKPEEVIPQQPEPTAIEEAAPEQAKPEKVTPQGSPPTERPKIPDPLPPPPKPLFLKVVLVSGLVIAVLFGLFLLKKPFVEPPPPPENPPISKEGPIVTPPANPDGNTGGEVTPPVPHIEPVIENLSVSMLDVNNNPIQNLVSGQTIKLESEYTIVAPPDLKMVEVEENNYLVMPDGTRSPDAIRTNQRGTGRVMSKQSITLPNEIVPGTYTLVATVKVGDKINKATQIIMIASGEKKHGQDKLIRQREIDDYLTEGKRLFENGEYQRCIDKMEEVIKRDKGNREANQYIHLASDRIEDIKGKFKNPTFGGSE